jgi:mannose-6-phosphate isomerase
MHTNGKITRIKGKIQHYHWGGFDYIPGLLGLAKTGNKSFAEYWLGTHLLGPAEIIETSDVSSLQEFIQQDPAGTLNNDVYRNFRGLPYLLKILDVRDMLSIQVHPAKTSAEAGFADEEARGVAITSAQRNYKDPNHKPELIAALSEFWLLHGFKPVDVLQKKLQEVKELNFLLAVFGNGDYKKLYSTVMQMSEEEVAGHLQALLDRIIPLYQENKLDKRSEDFWAARAALTYNQEGRMDRGIFSVYFFNLVRLQKGEAMFQDAGVPHAYLEGQNVEIMANSDNVLRGGLTHKHIDVPELMKHVIFEATVPHIISPVKKNSEETYHTTAPDFELSRFVMKPGETAEVTARSGEIFLLVSGKLLVKGEEDKLSAEKGDSFFLTNGQHVSLEALTGAELYRATVPAHTGV